MGVGCKGRYGSGVLREIWEWGAKEDMGVGC